MGVSNQSGPLRPRVIIIYLFVQIIVTLPDILTLSESP